MKIITLSKIGYNAPSQANWCYGIYKVDMIDTEQSYCMAYTVKENFGGDSRFKNFLKEKGINVIETSSVYTKTGTQKITGIANIEKIGDENETSEELKKDIFSFFGIV